MRNFKYCPDHKQLVARLIRVEAMVTVILILTAGGMIATF